jgi:hypothetical protein
MRTVEVAGINIDTVGGVEANRRVVFICHPMRGNVKDNTERVREICKLACHMGIVPFAPHLCFASFLKDQVPNERSLALAFDLEMLRRCDEVWVFGTDLTEGMRGEVQFAQWMGIPIRRVELDDARLVFDELPLLEDIEA